MGTTFPISQEVKASRQLIDYNKRFFFKYYAENEARRKSSKFQNSFYFSNILNMRFKQVVCSLILIYFDNPQLTIQ